MQELICFSAFCTNTLSFLYSLRLPEGGLQPPSPPKSATAYHASITFGGIIVVLDN